MSEDPNNVHITEIDCYHHLRNVWLGGMIKALSTLVKVELGDELENINLRFRVSPNIEMILGAVDKEFSLCANYPKGNGKLFKNGLIIITLEHCYYM